MASVRYAKPTAALSARPGCRNRLHELAAKNQDGRLTGAEQEELHGYLNVGMLLDLLQAMARVALKEREHSRR